MSDQAKIVTTFITCMTLHGCYARHVRVEYARCVEAMTAAVEVSEQAVHEEADRCRTNLEELGR